ncbi:MAG: hypothetical protein HGA65_15590 [Oscillochloris sp.]|nr:hypothetical protein [Oscillochloris sp.]
MSAPTSPDRSITRTYRAAIRLGEDFITLEETISLPLDASDEDIQQAVSLGWRIYTAQREAITQQIASVREAQAPPAPIVMRDPESPASEKQRNYIAALQDDLSWTNEQIASYAAEQHVDLVTMTKGQASGFIDSLKKVAEDRTRYTLDQSRGRTESLSTATQPASEKQIQALARIAQTRALDLDVETHQRFGVASDALTDEQARALLSQWQSRAARSRKIEPLPES